jgi:hypothetical protein
MCWLTPAGRFGRRWTGAKPGMVGAGGVGQGFAKEVEGTRFHNQGPNEEPAFDFLHVAKCRHSFVPSPSPTLVPTTHTLSRTHTHSLSFYTNLSLSLANVSQFLDSTMLHSISCESHSLCNPFVFRKNSVLLATFFFHFSYKDKVQIGGGCIIL